MPIYGYRCTQCNHELEVWQSMSDAPLTTCPECGGRLQKLLYPVGVQFKGSGFYSTDYKKNGSGGGSESGSPSSSESTKSAGSSKSSAESTSSGGESGTKSESKPASSGASSTDSKPG
jgi:putative FmdB family regulatory protein